MKTKVKDRADVTGGTGATGGKLTQKLPGPSEIQTSSTKQGECYLLDYSDTKVS